MLIAPLAVSESHFAPAARLVLRHVSHASPVMRTEPSTQYSFAHLVRQGPDVPQTQFWMIVM